MTIESKTDVARELAVRLAAIPGLELHRREPLARHTSFGIGGPADLIPYRFSPTSPSSRASCGNPPVPEPADEG